MKYREKNSQKHRSEKTPKISQKKVYTIEGQLCNKALKKEIFVRKLREK